MAISMNDSLPVSFSRTVGRLALLGALMTTACSLTGGALTEYQAPAPVIKSFRLAYPEATDAQYHERVRQGVKTYEVTFKAGDLEHEVSYMADGRLANPDQAEKPQKDPK